MFKKSLTRWLLAASLLLIAVVLVQSSLSAQSMKITPNQPAPDFSTTDAYGQPLSLHDLKGKKVLLSFQRFVGCPICNVRMHELLGAYDSLKRQNLELVVVYESSPENLLKYTEDAKFPFRLIADPEAKLYAQYGVGRSLGKMLNGMFHGGMKKARDGGKLYNQKLPRDGSLTRVEADFLIDPAGRVITAHYGHFVGDDLPLDEIRSFAGR